jgi:hypothetical protein
MPDRTRAASGGITMIRAISPITPSAAFLRSLSAGLFERLRFAIETGQQQGTFSKALNPRFAAISVVAQVGYLVLASPVAGILLGRGPGGPTREDVRAFGRHAAAFSLAALRDYEATDTRSTSPSLERAIP